MELPDQDKVLLRQILEKFQASEQRQKQHRSRWEHFYELYRSYRELRSESSRQPRDRDVRREAASTFGAELFVPVCFWTIETIVPRMLSQTPRMLILPRTKASSENVENMRSVIDSQQDQINYELVLQDVAKNGLIYGLGVQKTMWRRDECVRPRLERGMFRGWVRKDVKYVEFDDPVAEAVDPFDFFWAPYATSMADADYVLHRTWRTTPYVMQKLKTGAWPGVPDLTPEDLSRGSSRSQYSEVWQSRQKVSQISDTPKADIHEVLEYHDGDQVVTIVDRQWPVQVAPNPAVRGKMPFQIYRPTRLANEFVGIGEIEPLEDLQHELNTLRSQRRDNATLVLQKTFAYYDGFVNADDLKFGPGLAIPVNGDPRELLFPIPVGDIPNSGYQEEQALLNDIERTSGIADSVIGAEGSSGGASATATGAQLVHAAAGVRIQNKTKLLEKETIREAARQMVAMNQLRITSEREIRLPAPPMPGEADHRWTWRKIGPAELAGEFEVVPEGGSTAPDNTPQMRQDAQMKLQMLAQNPNIDQRVLLASVLRDLGVENPQTWMVPPSPEQQLPPGTLERAAALIDGLTRRQGLGADLLQRAAQPPGQGDQPEPSQNESPETNGRVPEEALA